MGDEMDEDAELRAAIALSMQVEYVLPLATHPPTHPHILHRSPPQTSLLSVLVVALSRSLKETSTHLIPWLHGGWWEHSEPEAADTAADPEAASGVSVAGPMRPEDGECLHDDSFHGLSFLPSSERRIGLQLQMDTSSTPSLSLSLSLSSLARSLLSLTLSALAPCGIRVCQAT
jgi:hypothetical protein